MIYQYVNERVWKQREKKQNKPNQIKHVVDGRSRTL